MPVPAPIVTWPWWRDLFERLARQELQTAAPIFAAVVAVSGHVNVAAVAWTLFGSGMVTAIKYVLTEVSGVTAPASGGLVVVVADRALPAFAGALLGFLPASWSGVLAMHWRDDLYAGVAAAVTALIAAYLAPPALTVAAKAGLKVVRA